MEKAGEEIESIIIKEKMAKKKLTQLPIQQGSLFEEDYIIRTLGVQSYDVDHQSYDVDHPLALIYFLLLFSVII